MRLLTIVQRFLNFEGEVNHPIAKELKEIDKIIFNNPEIVNMVNIDIQEGKKETGRYGMSADQVLKAALLKQFFGDSYEELAFRIQDSTTTKEFMKLKFGAKISSSTLQENIKKINSETWDFINHVIIQSAVNEGVEDIETIRTDSTVVKSNIHKPTDSALLMDCLRVFVRSIKELRKLPQVKEIKIGIKLKSAKKLAFKIINAKNETNRKFLYKKLLTRSRQAYISLLQILEELKKIEIGTDSKEKKQVKELERLQPLFKNIIFQTEQRVIEGKKLAPENKIVSIFEDHTDIIVKDRRETLFGHKIFLTSGKSNLILDYEIPRGNPSDKTKLLTTIDALKDRHDITPKNLAADAGFNSKENINKAIGCGINHITLGKDQGSRKYARKAQIPKMLKKWRAGIEGNISYLKRCFGLRCCDWNGFSGFLQYVKSAIATYNLRILARHLMA